MLPLNHKILLLDDDEEVLDVYREMFSQLPSKPEVRTATSGARAIALLEAEPFSLLVSDLSMPKMDGLQVLTIVRRRFPQLRTAVLTAVVDEQFRARAYAMGVDLYLEKPTTAKETAFLMDCIESLLGREAVGGFRGLQSKSLVDIIQLECLSQSSSVLKIHNGVLEGRVWIQGGEIIDAVAPNLTAEKAFQKILSWKTGSFEILPPQPERVRTIFNSYQGLLLESAQAFDEALANETGEKDKSLAAASPLAHLGKFSGVEFVIVLREGDKDKIEAWGLEIPEKLAAWVRGTWARSQRLGETLKGGDLRRIEGIGLQHHVVLEKHGDQLLGVGFGRSQSMDIVRETMKRVVTAWAS